MRTTRVLACAATLLFSMGVADAAVIIGNFGAATSTGGSVLYYPNRVKDVGLTMGAVDYNVDTVTLSLDVVGGGVPEVSLWSGTTAGPVTQLDILVNPTLTGIGDFVFTPSKQVTFQASQTYWLRVFCVSTTGQLYWLDSLPKTDPTGIATFVAWLWEGSPSSTKNRFQIDGSLASTCSGPAVEYGVGCPGSGGFVPHLSIDTCPIAGSSVQLTLDKALGGSSALVFLGLGQGALLIPGTNCYLNLQPLLPMTVLLPLGGTGAGNGSIVINSVLPPTTAGASATLQFFVIDPGVPQGYCNTNGVTLTIK